MCWQGLVPGLTAGRAGTSSPSPAPRWQGRDQDTDSIVRSWSSVNSHLVSVSEEEGRAGRGERVWFPDVREGEGGGGSGSFILVPTKTRVCGTNRRQLPRRCGGRGDQLWFTCTRGSATVRGGMSVPEVLEREALRVSDPAVGHEGCPASALGASPTVSPGPNPPPSWASSASVRSPRRRPRCSRRPSGDTWLGRGCWRAQRVVLGLPGCPASPAR